MYLFWYGVEGNVSALFQSSTAGTASLWSGQLSLPVHTSFNGIQSDIVPTSKPSVQQIDWAIYHKRLSSGPSNKFYFEQPSTSKSGNPLTVGKIHPNPPLWGTSGHQLCRCHHMPPPHTYGWSSSVNCEFIINMSPVVAKALWSSHSPTVRPTQLFWSAYSAYTRTVSNPSSSSRASVFTSDRSPTGKINTLEDKSDSNVHPHPFCSNLPAMKEEKEEILFSNFKKGHKLTLSNAISATLTRWAPVFRKKKKITELNRFSRSNPFSISSHTRATTNRSWIR